MVKHCSEKAVKAVRFYLRARELFFLHRSPLGNCEVVFEGGVPGNPGHWQHRLNVLQLPEGTPLRGPPGKYSFVPLVSPTVRSPAIVRIPVRALFLWGVVPGAWSSGLRRCTVNAIFIGSNPVAPRGYRFFLGWFAQAVKLSGLPGL